MSRLYEGESLEIYNPSYGTKSSQPVQSPVGEEAENKALEEARAAAELLESAGWKNLKQTLGGEVARLTASLVEASEPATVARLQAAIKVYGNIEGFINRYVQRGQIAMDNREIEDSLD